MANYRRRGRERGFTLVELTVVLAILATLATLYVPAVGAVAENAALYKARADLRAIDGAMLLGAPPSPLPEPPVLLPGAASSYQVDGSRQRAYLPMTVNGQAIRLYSDTPLPAKTR
ncbi:type II secretion system protein [Anaeroselena agilis]|uniref:Prepilin-type N-terminal cleavage/methylation domain-containing protein n=1 Tax=Anaeroselena agilis TaxID=3063788 RepID=A0ABU3P0C4_9FIRM|nr:prepilin-type N-terminal cleavage/methylation domain-containing protein [Selenomonadales bacterium 4137-cl]